jgi:hypothetical protein
VANTIPAHVVFENELLSVIDKAINKEKIPMAFVYGILNLQASSMEAQVLDSMFNHRLQKQLLINAKLKTDEIKSEITKGIEGGE